MNMMLNSEDLNGLKNSLPLPQTLLSNFLAATFGLITWKRTFTLQTTLKQLLILLINEDLSSTLRDSSGRTSMRLFGTSLWMMILGKAKTWLSCSAMIWLILELLVIAIQYLNSSVLSKLAKTFFLYLLKLMSILIFQNLTFLKTCKMIGLSSTLLQL